MRKARFLALPLLALTLSGCLAVSLHPLYRDSDTVFRPELVGRWIEDDSDKYTWEIAKSGDRAYRIAIADQTGKHGVFDGHLVPLGDALFLDLYPADMDISVVDIYAFHLIPAHSFMIVRRVTPSPSFAPLDEDWVKTLLKTTPGALRHEMIGDSGRQLLLTAQTADLQRFVIKHAKTADAFGASIDLKPEK